jgi:2-(1,2-epoxy-1,2-dihydrophenyl)acetyl-CoA isomerase
MSGEFEKMTFEVDDGVAIVTLNRPEARNALDEALRRDLGRAITRIEEGAGSTIHAAVLTGAGGAFCAGGTSTCSRKCPPNPLRIRASGYAIPIAT